MILSIYLYVIKKYCKQPLPFIKNNMVTMGSAPPNCKFSGLLRYKRSKALKGSNEFTLRANSDLRVFRCDIYSGDINYPNNTVIPEREGTNDVGSEGGGENLRGRTYSGATMGRGDDQESR